MGLLHELLGAEPLLVGDLILLEVLQGVQSDLQAARVEAALRRFDIRPMLDPQLAVLAAGHYRWLRALGVTLRKTVDLVIGTFCIAHDHDPADRRSRLHPDGAPPRPQARLSRRRP